jgi:type I restriction enzyme S subunit
MRSPQARSLPEKWNWEALGSLCNFISGVTFDKTEAVSSPLPEYLPILRAGHISDTLNTTDDLIWVPRERVSEVQLLKTGDIVMCMSSGSPQVVGKSAIVDKPFNGSLGAFCSIIRTKRVEQRPYVAYWLKSEDFMQWRDDQARGVNIQNLRASQLKNIRIPLPPLDEQKRIAAILSKADRLRRLRRYARELSDGYLGSVFLEMFGDPVSNPMGWDTPNIGSLAVVKTGGTPSRTNRAFYGGQVPWVKTTEVVGSVIYYTEETLTKQGLEASNCEIFPVGTILVAMYGQGLTRGRSAKLGIPAATNQACAAVLPSPKIDTDYLWSYLKLSYRRLRDLGRGGNQPNLNLSMVKTFAVPLPPHTLQRNFTQIVQRFERLRAQQREAERQAEHLFGSLLGRAFRGEI